MNQVIRSVLEYPELLQSFSRDHLSSQEKKYFDYIDESYENSQVYPSLDLMNHKFPELRFDDTVTLSQEDAKIEIDHFFKDRENKEASRVLMTLASQVAQTGLTPEILSQIPSTPTSSDHQDTLESIDSFRAHYENKKSKPEGIVTNIKAIDDKIGGISYGTMMTIGGFTSHGKSLLANNMAYHNAMKLKYNICILSLEVPKEQLMSNLLMRHSKETEFASYPKVKARDIEKGRLNEEQEDFVFNTLLPDFYNVEEHGIIKIFDESDIADTSMVTMKNLLIKADDECRARTGYPLDCVIVDHLQLLKFDSKSVKSEMAVINEAVSYFHKLCLNFRTIDGEVQQLSAVLLSQLNRDGYKKAIKTRGAYNLTAFADANEIERSSQYLMTIFMDQDLKLGKEAAVCLLKNRNGECVPEPTTVFCSPEDYVIGDSMSEGFADMISGEDLDDIFNGGSITDLI